MFRHQYLAVSRVHKPDFLDITPQLFNGLTFYAGDGLYTSIAKHGSTELCLLGQIIDPQRPHDSNDTILQTLAQYCGTQDTLFKEIQGLSGRYVLIYKNDSSFLVVGDACNLRQIYFSFLNGEIVLTSSTQMFLGYFGYELQMSQLKQDFINHPAYYTPNQKRESAWYGHQGFDDRLDKLLPNHYLDLQARQVKRIPLYPVAEGFREREITDYAASVLKSTFTAMSDRYSLIQAITAGSDSRMLLAASKDYRNQIFYFIFHGTSKQDIEVSGRLAKRLNLPFHSIQPDELRPDFLEAYQKDYALGRVLRKTAHVQYHYDHFRDRNVVNVNGNCSGVIKCHYGYTRRKISLDMLIFFSGYPSNIPYLRQELGQWLDEATPYADKYDIPILDLFYWEQRMGHWGALSSFEKDIALEEISPFNNKSLLLSLFKVSPWRRMAPDYLFFKRLMQTLWPEVLSEPINPDNKRIQAYLKRYPYLRYYLRRLIK